MALLHETNEVSPGITADPQVMHGKPVIAGTRIPAALIAAQFAAGESFDALAEAYGVTAAQVRAAIGFTATVADEATYHNSLHGAS